MKKTMCAFILAGLAFVAIAQDSGDGSSGSDSSVLRKARQKYEQRHDDRDGKKAKKTVKRKKKKIVRTTRNKKYVTTTQKRKRVFDLKTFGNPDESDYKVVVTKRPVRRIYRNRSFLRFVAFLGLADFFGFDDVDIDVDIDIDAAPDRVAKSGSDDTMEFVDEGADEDAESSDAELGLADDAELELAGDDEDIEADEVETEAVEAEEEEHEDELEFVEDGDGVEDEGRDAPRFFPIVLSVIPGIGFPPGVRDANINLGMIGSAMRNVNGFSSSGVFDIVEESLVGFQSAGVFSIAGGEVKGGQFSGVFNIGGTELRGIQAAGVFNIAEDVRGVQWAGVANMAHDVTGIQAAGVINVANDVRGTQIGLVNISQNCYGIPIGLINITKNGIRDVGFWMDEGNNVFGFWANGTNNFYTLLFAGESLDDIGVDWNTFSAGAGIGYRANLGPLHLDTDLSAKFFFGDTWADMLIDAKDGGPVASAYYASLEPSDCPANPWPYGPLQVFPMARMSLGIPVLKLFEVFGGVSVDIGVDGTYPVPAPIRDVKGYGFDVFGTPMEVYPHFFWGIKF